jgi:hypothetical protein
MDKEEMDAAVAEHRAQLLAEAEKELAAEKQQAARAALETSRADRQGRSAPAAGGCYVYGITGSRTVHAREGGLQHSVTADLEGRDEKSKLHGIPCMPACRAKDTEKESDKGREADKDRDRDRDGSKARSERKRDRSSVERDAEARRERRALERDRDRCAAFSPCTCQVDISCEQSAHAQGSHAQLPCGWGEPFHMYWAGMAICTALQKPV